MERPQTIVRFERLYLLAIAIEVARILADWPALMRSSSPDIWLRVAAVLLSVALVLLASRLRNRGAAIILAALFAIGLPMVSSVLSSGLGFEASLAVLVQVLLQLVALVSLFMPASRAWFRGARSEPVSGPNAPS